MLDEQVYSECLTCGTTLVTDQKSVSSDRKRRFAALKMKYTAAKTSGYTHKIWVSKGGPKVRSTHHSASGQKVKIDDYFRVGGEKLFLPSDPDGAFKETANCRCDVKYTTDIPKPTMPVSAYDENRSTIIVYANNVEEVRTGGTRAWRNNNPGNLRNYRFSQSHNSLGTAGGFAVFSSEEAGYAALMALLQTKTYQSLSIIDAIRRYAPPNENNTENYQNFIDSVTGIEGNTPMNTLTTEQTNKVAAAIKRMEGWRVGDVKWRLSKEA